MKSNTAYRTKLRAVFLAAIMVTSVVGMSVAFTGAAAANPSNFSPDFPYQGQDVTLENNTEDFSTGEYELRRVDDFSSGGQVEESTFVRELTDVDGTGTGSNLIISTDNLDADDYFVRGGDLPRNPPEAQTFEVRIQDIDAAFDDDVVTTSGQDSTTDLDIESNRGTYSVNASANGDLDEGELLEVFINQGTVGGEAVIDLHQTDAIRNNVSFAADDKVEIDPNGNTVGPARFNSLTDTQKATFFQSGLDELNESLGASDWDAINESLANSIGSGNTIIDSQGNILNNGDFVEAFETANPFVAFAYNEELDDAEEQVVLVDIQDREEEVDFTGTDEGDYTFDFDVSDTEASASVDITVREEDVDGAFSQGVYQQTAGDIVEFEFELEDTDEVWIQIGDQDAGFVDVVYIEADDEDEPVTFQVNTRTLGADATFSNVYSLGDNVDTLESAIHSTTTSNIGTDQFYNDNTEQSLNFEQYLEALDLIDDAGSEDGFDQLTRPMQPTDYELVAAAAGDDGTFIVNDDDESEADNELDSAVLELQSPGLSEITTWVAPADDADEDDTIEELLESVTEREDIALGDRLVVQYEASGIFGGMVAASDDDFDILEDGTSADLIAEYDGGLLDDEGINFLFESEDAIGNQDPTSLDFSNLDDESEAFLIFDNEGGQFFLVVDTDADVWASGEPEDGDSFEIELEYETDDDNRARFDDVGQGNANDALSLSPAGYPYFAADSTQAISAEISFEDAAISFNNLNADNEIQAENTEDSEISGVTNIAPGSSGEIRVASTDASTSFRNGQSVDIGDDGSVLATFDFSTQEVGDEFNTRFRIGGSNIDTVASVIVEEGTLSVAEPVDEEPVEDDEPVDDEPEPVDDDDDDDDEPIDDETPGFGVLVALFAILGAALLATRRQN